MGVSWKSVVALPRLLSRGPEIDQYLGFNPLFKSLRV